MGLFLTSYDHNNIFQRVLFYDGSVTLRDLYNSNDQYSKATLARNILHVTQHVGSSASPQRLRPKQSSSRESSQWGSRAVGQGQAISTYVRIFVKCPIVSKSKCLNKTAPL